MAYMVVSEKWSGGSRTGEKYLGPEFARGFSEAKRRLGMMILEGKRMDPELRIERATEIGAVLSGKGYTVMMNIVGIDKIPEPVVPSGKEATGAGKR